MGMMMTAASAPGSFQDDGQVFPSGVTWANWLLAGISPSCPGAVVGFVQSRCSTATGAVRVSRDRRQNHLWLCLLNAFAV